MTFREYIKQPGIMHKDIIQSEFDDQSDEDLKTSYPEAYEEYSRKAFTFEVTIIFTQTEDATTEEKAIEKLKESFKQEYNLDVEDSEIELIK